MKLSDGDILAVVNKMPMGLVQLMESEDVFLAGGAIRAVIAGEEIKDFDMFAASKEEARYYAERLSFMLECDGFLETENAFTVRDDRGIIPDIQFIHRWTFDNPNDLIASFDYTIAQAAIWHDGLDWKSVASNTFLDDLHAKRLTYTAPDRHEDAGGSLLRMRKFLKRGYDISSCDMAKVIARMLNGGDMEAFSYQTEKSLALQINEVLTDAYGEPVND